MIHFKTHFKRHLISVSCFLTLSALGVELLSPSPGNEIVPSTSPASLAYYLATNTAAYADGRDGGYGDMLEIRAPNSTGLDRLTSATWSQSFWLKNVQGLGATPIGFTNLTGGQGLPTMVSPRHYLCATHMHPEGYLIAFLDTNNLIHWRRTLQRVDIGQDTTIGILDEDLPPAVGFLPVLPANYTNYLSESDFVQGIGMNQDFCLFGQPMMLRRPYLIWNSQQTAPCGLGKNWNVTIRAGDSSNPAMLIINNQLILVSHNYSVGSGPNYPMEIPAINQAMHQLSVKYHTRTDYQLTEFPLDHWPRIR